MTDREAADFLRIKPRQLFDWRMNGLIPYITVTATSATDQAVINAMQPTCRLI